MAIPDIGTSRTGSCAARSDDIWKVAEFLDIESMIGRHKARKILATYIAQLRVASDLIRSGGFDTRQMRETAHDLKSMSGQLGFSALQDYCEIVLSAEFAISAIEPLMALITASSEAAHLYCRRSVAADVKSVAA